MKKKFWKSLLTLGLTIPMVIGVSCTDDNPDTDKPVDSDKPGPEGNEFVTTNVVTPLRYTEMEYKAGDEGVSISVFENASNNIFFECEPGSEVASYRVNVYPVSSLYNSLLNERNANKVEKYTPEEVNELIFLIISNTESEVSGGKLMNPDALGEDYASCEFDWMNSPYKTFDIKPGSEYLIAVQAYFDVEGKESPADLCLCHVKTATKELEGNPTVVQNVTSGFFSYEVEFVMNEDCLGMYYLSSTTEEIQEYIDCYGEQMYMELLCHYGALVQNSDSNYSFTAKDMLQGVEYCTTALAVDRKGTPSKTLARVDFFLKEPPKDTETASGSIDLPHKIASSICHFKVHMDKNCLRMAYNAYPTDTAEEIMKWDEQKRKDLAMLMVTGRAPQENPGWVVVNSNYALDRDNGTLTGEGYDGLEWQHDLSSEEEYKIIYAMMNGYGEATDLCITPAFTTKKLVKDNPEAFSGKISMKISSTTRNAVNVEVSYEPENVARYYFQYYAPIDENNPLFKFPEINDDSMEARLDPENGWLYWFLDWRDPSFGFPWPSFNNFLVGEGTITEIDYYSGFDPGTRYYFVGLAEDWNGVLSPIIFFDGTTQTVVGGDNPTMEITTEMESSGSRTVKFTCNEDTRQLYHMISTIENNQYKDLALTELMKPDFGGISYEEYLKSWEEALLQNGIKTNELTTTQDLPESELAVVLGMAVGGKTEGEPVYGELQTLIYCKSTGKMQTLAEYMGVDKK